jgi:hypothetical protein
VVGVFLVHAHHHKAAPSGQRMMRGSIIYCSGAIPVAATQVQQKGHKMSVKINGYDLPSHISYSQLTTWLDCGWKYYLSRIVQLKEDGSWWLVGGSSVHEATEAFDHAMYQEVGK